MRLVRHSYATTILALCLFASCLPARAQMQFEGQRIVSVAFVPEHQPLPTSEIAKILPIAPNQTYHASAVRAAIERLYATGRYQDIQVDASEVGGGVGITFITRSSWFVGHVGVESDISQPPSAGQIVSASGFDLGVPFDPGQLSIAETRIRKLLTDNGYFSPEVYHQLDYDTAYQQVRITFVISTGKRARYDTPKITGDTSVLTATQIDKATDWHRFLFPGYRGITQNRTRSGIDHIRLKYQNANRLLATVTLDSLDKEDTGKKGPPRAEPHITVDPGAIVDVELQGAKVSRRTLKENVPVFEEHTVDADLLTEGASNLRDYFQARGYFDAEVEFKQQEIRNGKTEIHYIVTPGAHHRFVYLQIDGNKYFDLKTLRERLFLIPKSFEFRNGRYSDALRKRDEETIADLYRANGFRDVKVTSRTVDDYKGKKGDEAVFFTIDEGSQYKVAALQIIGTHKLDIAKTIDSLNSQTGQVFSEFDVGTDRETIIAEYGKNGFQNATVEWDTQPGPLPHTVDLRFVIDEGDQQFVRQVIATGLETTRPGLVQKRFDLKPGDPLSQAAMTDTQRKLYDLGIFAQVNMAIQNPDGEEDQKNVLYDIEEARRYSITTGFGAEFARIGSGNALTDLAEPGGATGVSPRVTLDMTRLNLLGTGQSVTLQSRLSTLQKRASITYFIPRVFNLTKFDATFSILYDDTHDVNTFRAIRREAAAQVIEHFSKSITMFYRFNYRKVGVSDLAINPLLVPLIAQSVRVGIGSFNFVQDRRDDPIDPHKGIYNTVDVGLATKAFGSQTSFVRVLARNATYYRLGSKLVLARETQFGVEPAFNVPPGTEQTTAEQADAIPLPERFFGGGGNTQRGFPQNQAGPRDFTTGFPLGGSALFFNNTELRFPLYGANINGVLFEDAGNIYSSISQLSFRTDQRNNEDFNYMVHAAGFGVRYRTPVGPLRFDLAYSINPPKYRGFPGSYVQLVQCSEANTCQASEQEISHFQFFFSIGQAF
jgi:outer membrane protein assembly complex protein YaeT